MFNGVLLTCEPLKIRRRETIPYFWQYTNFHCNFSKFCLPICLTSITQVHIFVILESSVITKERCKIMLHSTFEFTRKTNVQNKLLGTYHDFLELITP